MHIEKFEARTEVEALEKVKDKLGMHAKILQIGKKKPRGLFRFFRRPKIEVTAAVERRAGDEESSAKDRGLTAKEEMEITKALRASTHFDHAIDDEEDGLADIGDAFEEQVRQREENAGREYPAREEKATEAETEGNAVDTSGFGESFKETALKESKIRSQEEEIKRLQEQLSSTQGVLESLSNQVSVDQMLSTHSPTRKYEVSVIQLIYETLLEKGVNPLVAEDILSEVDVDSASIDSESNEIDINLLIKIVYNRIVEIIGDVEVITSEDVAEEPKVFFFFGSTGVGKTTTIAKLSADFVLNQQINVGLITADTYRIAAVEQLKVYGDILGIEVKVAYQTEDLAAAIEKSKDEGKELIMIDTAGRSHKDAQSLQETLDILDEVPEAERFLVLSVATRYEDLLEIMEAYKQTGPLRIIFTKLDETDQVGSILNVCYATNCELSYVTIGQNVPDDIEKLSPHKIAQALLGLGDGYGSSR